MHSAPNRTGEKPILGGKGEIEMDLQLAGKVVAITGGTAGIDLAVATRFWREGCKVAVCGRREEKLRHMREEFAERFLAVRADASRLAELRAFAQVVMEAFGRIDKKRAPT